RVGVAGDRIEVVVELLHVLAVVALFVRQPEQPLLQNGIVPVPQRDRETEELPVVAEAGDAVLAPAIGPAARLGVSPIVPCGAAGAVVLAHRAPLPFAHVGAPALPVLCALAALLDALPFGVKLLRHR